MPDAVPITDPPAPPDLATTLDALLAKHAGDPNAALRTVLVERDGMRDQLGQAKSKLPPDGAIVLAGDDTKVWGAYQALGKPDELKTRLDGGAAATAKVVGFEREKLHGEAAGLHGYKPSVLTRLAVQDGLEIVLQDAKDKAGKDVKVAAVKGEGDKTTPLTDYAAKHWTDFLPSLKGEPAKPAAPAGSPMRGGYTPPRPPIVPPAGSSAATGARRKNLL